MNRLDGCIALVTGAGRGIGAAIALRYAREGANVTLTDLNEAGVNAVAEQVRALGVQADAFVVDVREPAQTAAMVERVVKRFGRLDLMVNNAGVIRVKSFLDTTPEDWDFIQSVNVRGLFFALQAGARQMLKQSPLGEGRPCGKILNLASIAGRGGRPMLAAYSASKATVINITQTAALEFAPRVTVNALCPGPVDTDMWKLIDEEWSRIEGKPPGSIWKDRTRAIPMGRPEKPDDLTGMAAFLAGREADYITGQSFNIDGGLVTS
jgi:meso-butanediol dehydrogenase/(S,S)-butanediol dehydrogenase/diacetyl reductase